MKISTQSSWNASEIEKYLLASKDPMRFSVMSKDGFPLICSIWHWYEAGYLYAVSHKDSLLIKTLAENKKCAFDISVNSPPYLGVRGKGIAAIEEDAGIYLPKLIDKFLGTKYQSLQHFLTGRLGDERLIKIEIQSISSWDFSDRMQ